MSVQIYRNNIEYITLWPVYADVTCDNCKKIHPYSKYCIDKRCNRCGEEIGIYIYMIDTMPVAFDSKIEYETFKKRFENVLLIANILDYKITYVMGVNYAWIETKIINASSEEYIVYRIHLTKTCLFKKAKVNSISYQLSQKAKKHEIVFDDFNNLEKILEIL